MDENETKAGFEKSDWMRIQHTAQGYGAELYGGTPEARRDALEELIEGPHASVDCREVESLEGFIRRGIESCTDGSVKDNLILSDRDLTRALNESGRNLLVLEFQAMESDVRTSVAQLLKGAAERRNAEFWIGYTCAEGGAVVDAEFDLSMRVQSWEIQDS